jgi:phosphoribosyl-dephospho-CoA transferase
MCRFEAHSFRPHYLLEVDPDRLIEFLYPPEWVGERLRTIPFVVVRRGPATGPHIAVGVRGAERNQRWPTFCEPGVVKSIVTPPQLLGRASPGSRGNAAPALRSLRLLESRWMDVDHCWGPGGSVGFELATGSHAVKAESDLDIVIYADTPMTADEARLLCARAMGLPAAVDIRVETPVCGFSLREYAYGNAAGILLRMPDAVVLGRGPWGSM